MAAPTALATAWCSTAITDADRADRERVERDVAAAAQSEREQIGHSEERANAADLDDVVGLARKAVTEGADVGRRAADVDDERVAEPREKGRAAHAVGRPGRE